MVKLQLSLQLFSLPTTDTFPCPWFSIFKLISLPIAVVHNALAKIKVKKLVMIFFHFTSLIVEDYIYDL
jgi:hypothetical protein